MHQPFLPAQIPFLGNAQGLEPSFLRLYSNSWPKSMITPVPLFKS
jgi:hypothetical protein